MVRFFSDDRFHRQLPNTNTTHGQRPEDEDDTTYAIAVLHLKFGRVIIECEFGFSPRAIEHVNEVIILQKIIRLKGLTMKDKRYGNRAAVGRVLFKMARTEYAQISLLCGDWNG